MDIRLWIASKIKPDLIYLLNDRRELIEENKRLKKVIKENGNLMTLEMGSLSEEGKPYAIHRT